MVDGQCLYIPIFAKVEWSSSCLEWQLCHFLRVIIFFSLLLFIFLSFLTWWAFLFFEN